jgi:xylulokinase
MEKEPYILAVDLGTSGCKTALISATGKVAGWESQALPLLVLPAGGAEQDPNDWWNAFLSTARCLVQKDLVPVDQIVAVCCSTQGEGTVAVDGQGQALMNAILWMDMRGAKHLAEITQGRVNLAGYDPRKIYRWVKIAGGAPSLSGKDPAAHMLLIRNEYPEIYQKTYKFLNVLDYMNLRLSGRFAATPDSILTSWVTDNRDSAHVLYSPELLQDCGISAEKFPEILPCTAVLGDLKAEVAADIGLKPGVKVIAGSIDVTSAAVGSGAVGDYQAHLYIGTSSWIAAHVPFKKTDVLSSLASVPCAIPGKYLMIVMQTTAGGNLNFLCDRLLFPKNGVLGGNINGDIFQRMDEIAANTPTGSHGLIYAPWVYGERSPIEDKNARGILFNLSLENNQADLVRAVFEGVALNTRWMVAPAEKFMGRKLGGLTLVGGGAKSAVWCQIFADVLNLPIRQASDPIQANARGAAWIAATGLGYLHFDEIPGLIGYQAEYLPEPANRAIYDRLFKEFVELYRRNKGIFKRLNDPKR